MKQLFGFQKVMLAPGGSADLFFAASAEAFMLVGKEVLQPARALTAAPSSEMTTSISPCHRDGRGCLVAATGSRLETLKDMCSLFELCACVCVYICACV